MWGATGALAGLSCLPEVGVPVGGALQGDLPQLHLVAGQSSGLVREHVRHLQTGNRFSCREPVALLLHRLSVLVMYQTRLRL